MVDMVRRHETQVLRRAGHSLAEPTAPRGRPAPGPLPPAGSEPDDEPLFDDDDDFGSEDELPEHDVPLPPSPPPGVTPEQPRVRQLGNARRALAGAERTVTLQARPTGQFTPLREGRERAREAEPHVSIVTERGAPTRAHRPVRLAPCATRGATLPSVRTPRRRCGPRRRLPFVAVPRRASTCRTTPACHATRRPRPPRCSSRRCHCRRRGWRWGRR